MLGHAGVDYLRADFIFMLGSFIANKRNPEPLPSSCVCPIQANSATHHLCEILLVVLGLFCLWRYHHNDLCDLGLWFSFVETYSKIVKSWFEEKSDMKNLHKKLNCCDF